MKVVLYKAKDVRKRINTLFNCFRLAPPILQLPLVSSRLLSGEELLVQRFRRIS